MRPSLHAASLLAVLAFLLGAPGLARAAETAVTNHPIVILETEGTVEVMRSGAASWDPAVTTAPYHVLKPGDQLRTAPNSRAAVRLSNLTVIRVDKNSLLRIPEARKEGAFFEFVRGILYFFHRDKPGDLDIDTPRVSAVIRGTEFNLRVDDDGTTTFTLFDGEVGLTNAQGGLVITTGQEAEVRPDQPPRRTASIFTLNTVQWCLYYPGILHLDDLDADSHLTAAGRSALGASMDAYRAGNIPGALRAYPEGREPGSGAERCYLAALVLSVGDVARAESLLAEVEAGAGPSERLGRVAAALRQLIAAVKFEPFQRVHPPELATEWMAVSYHEQSRSNLEAALHAARNAATAAPRFGFAKAREAELEFGFGRIDDATRAVDHSLVLSPDNAQAVSLKGFLAAADNRLGEAMIHFDRARELDGALGNAWLGRGLVHMRQGRIEEGLDNIQVAAVLEPQRSLMRSYLGKAYSRAGDDTRAAKELDLGIRLDPNDPTPWMYAALVYRQQNRVNDAVEHLERSRDLNEARKLYRSQTLLDQDLAVRSANLANVYTDAGMNEVGLREASKSINASYANYSGHLFLANSYQRLLDPGRVSLRFESPAVSEYLLANLLAPVGAGTLSPGISQQEYSRMFESQGFGAVSTTEYLSRGAWTQNGALYGAFGNSAFAFGAFHVHDNGQRKNNDLDLTSYSVSWKQQLTSRDAVFAQVLWSDAESGDVTPRFNPFHVNPSVRVTETQDPILVAGYHREWTPGSDTLILGTRLDDTLTVQNPFQQLTLMGKDAGGRIVGVLDTITNRPPGPIPVSIDQDYRAEMSMHTAEAQHILQKGSHTWIAGARLQSGDFDTFNQHTPTADSFVIVPSTTFFAGLDQSSDADFLRAGAYAYHQWQVIDPLMLMGGVAYDWMRYPANFRFAPVTDDEDTVDQVSPKAGFVLTPWTWASLQGSYARGLGGASFERSFSLEPTQVAGLNQLFRSVMPEAVTGANTAEDYDLFSLALGLKLPTRTYIDLVGQWMRSDVDRDVGVYDAFFVPAIPFIFPGQTRQSLDYHEQSLGVAVNQLVGRNWALGAAYQYTKSDLSVDYRDVPDSALLFADFQTERDLQSHLHHVKLSAIYNHPCGFFAEGQTHWFQQSNRDSRVETDADDFWQFNVFAGYRLFQRRAEITLGVLNLTDRSYRLSPMNLTPNLARERTFAMRFRLAL